MLRLITDRVRVDLEEDRALSIKLFQLLLIACATCWFGSGCRSSGNRFLPPRMERSELVIPSRWHHSYESAVQEAAESGKPILVNFTGSDWCHWCVKLKQDVFSTPEFEAWARENAVLLELDFPRRSAQSVVLKQQNQELAKRYGINSYPSVLLINAEGEKLGDRLGYLADPDEWIANASLQISGPSATTTHNPIQRNAQAVDVAGNKR